MRIPAIRSGEATQKKLGSNEGRGEQNAALQTRGGGRAGHRLLVPDDGVARPCSARFVCVSVKHGRFGFGGLCLASLLGGVGLDQLQPPRVPIAFELREPACAFAEHTGAGSLHAALRMVWWDPPTCEC